MARKTKKTVISLTAQEKLKALNKILLAEREQRRESEEALVQAKEDWERTFDSVPDMIAILDAQHRILRVNRSMVQRLGITLEECVGQPCYKFVHGTSEPPKFCPYSQTLKDGQQHLEEIHENRLDLDLLVSTTPMFDGEGKMIGAVHVARDITERKRAEEILQRDKETFERQVEEKSIELIETRVMLERAKRLSDIGTLASTVAHELRNPLAAINMASANIKRKAKNPDDLLRHLETINKKVTESDQIINNLLFYSRLKSPNYENVNLFNIIRESVSQAKARGEHKIIIDERLETLTDVLIEADSLQLTEVFSNILNNACDAVSPEGGKIIISGVPNDGLVKISVADNGAGIEADNLPRVFDPFFTTKAKGTGLGLSVCQQIIHLHAGDIGMESTVGKGTTVTMTLPLNRRSGAKK